jgi:hypothetical protein
MTAPKKPTDAEIRSMADTRIKELMKTNGPGLTEDQVLEQFREWVLPDRQLTIIRERLERWKDVASKRAARRG